MPTASAPGVADPPMTRSTPLATTVDLDPFRNLTVHRAGEVLHPTYGPAMARLPDGRQTFRGLPFDLGPGGRAARWVLVDRPTTIPLAGRASHVVVAHLCDTWRDETGQRPAGLSVGHVVPVGQPLARYTVEDGDGRRWSRVIRRRFEVNDGRLGWGSVAFASVSHLDNEVVDWRGPHPRQAPGRYAPAGQSGALTIMPGGYGTSQTGVTDFVPSPTDDVLLWLHAIPIDADAAPVALTLEPLAADRPGSAVVVAAVTMFRGTADPLARGPRFQARVAGGRSPTVDLGVVIRTSPAPAPRGSLTDAGSSGATVVGWGTPRVGGARPDGDELVDLAIAPDAIVDLGGWTVTGGALDEGARQVDPGGRRSIEVLPAPRLPVEVEVVDLATGERIPARVRFTAADGRYLPPDGHRDEINPGLYEDTGGDLILGSASYAYVPGTFSIRLPAGEVEVEVVAGFGRRPLRTALTIEPSTRRLELALERVVDLHARGWVAADSHVHFVAPSTALLQAAAEDVDLVNLLATQWGDLYTSVVDLPWGTMADPSGRRLVVVGTENRQNVLGHLALLGARQPTHPLASGGPPEGRMAGALEVLLADWAERCRAAGGLVIGAHFPLPYAEIAADIVAGRIDAIEAQALSPGLDDPAIVEWYRFLDLGYRLPIVAGTDKMSAEVPVGAVRTYSHLLSDEALTFDGWAAAVRAGRTFITSGPLIELTVDGREPGDVIRLGGPASLETVARVRAAQPVIGDLELLVNGRVVAATHADGGARTDGGVTQLTLREDIRIDAGSWIAARSRSPYQIESAFTTSMAAHTSPVYVEVAGRPLVPSPEDARVVEQVILGARTWVAELAAVAEPAERARMVAFFDASLQALSERMAGRRPRGRRTTDPRGGGH